VAQQDDLVVLLENLAGAIGGGVVDEDEGRAGKGASQAREQFDDRGGLVERRDDDVRRREVAQGSASALARAVPARADGKNSLSSAHVPATGTAGPMLVRRAPRPQSSARCGVNSALWASGPRGLAATPQRGRKCLENKKNRTLRGLSGRGKLTRL